MGLIIIIFLLLVDASKLCPLRPSQVGMCVFFSFWVSVSEKSGGGGGGGGMEVRGVGEVLRG